MPRPFVSGPAGQSALVGAKKGKLGERMPELMSWVCDAAYADGTPLGQTQLKLRRQGPLIVATLQVADQGGLKLEAVDDSPEKALAALEALLQAESVPWCPDPFPIGVKRADKKK